MILLQIGVHEDDKSAEEIRSFRGFSTLDGLPQLRPLHGVQVPGLVERLEGLQGVEVDDDALSWKRVPTE